MRVATTLLQLVPLLAALLPTPPPPSPPSIGPAAQAAPPEEARADAGTLLAGRVVDASGLPLFDAVVLALEDDPLDRGRLLDARVPRTREPLAARTDRDGRFELGGLRPGPVRIRVRKDGYATRDVEGLRLAQHGCTEAGAFALSAARLVSGRVVDAHGAPVADAEVTAVLPERASGNEGWRVARFLARTDASGGFATEVLDDGAWTLVVGNVPLPETRYPSAVPPGGDRHVELALPAAGSIAGMVVTLPDGRLEDVVVHALPLAVTDAPEDVPARELLGWTAVTVEADGAFELRGLRAGAVYSVVALPAGVPPRRADAWSAPRLVPCGTPALRLEAAHGARLRFRAVDGRTGDAVERFDVRLLGAFEDRERADDGSLRGALERPWSLHSKGRVELDGLRPADDEPAVLIVAAAGYAPLERTLELAPGATLALGDLHLTPRPVLEVQVTAAATGEPVHGALLSVLPLTDDEPIALPATRAYTDADGVGRVEDRPGRARLLGVRAPGFAPLVLTSPFPTESDESERVLVPLERGATAHVRVTGPEGAPLVALPVGHRAEDEHLARLGWTQGVQLTDSAGVARIAGLAPGVHRFECAGSGSPAPHEWALARFDGDDVLELALGSTPPARFTGRVTEAGRPLAGAAVALTPVDGGEPYRTRSTESGAFELLGLAPGAYVAEWHHPARAVPLRARVELDPGRNEHDVDLPWTVLAGTVRDEQGRPAVGVELRIARAGGPADDVFDPAREPPLALSDAYGAFALRGVDPALPLQLLAHDPRTGAAALATVEGPGTSEVELVLARGAELRVAPLDSGPPGLGGPHALLATHAPMTADGTTVGPAARERTVVPYAGGEAVFRDLEPGAWTLTVAALDGFGRVTATWVLAAVELRAGERRTLVPE